MKIGKSNNVTYGVSQRSTLSQHETIGLQFVRLKLEPNNTTIEMIRQLLGSLSVFLRPTSKVFSLQHHNSIIKNNRFPCSDTLFAMFLKGLPWGLSLFEQVLTKVQLKGRYTFGSYSKNHNNLKTDLVSSIGELLIVQNIVGNDSL